MLLFANSVLDDKHNQDYLFCTNTNMAFSPRIMAHIKFVNQCGTVLLICGLTILDSSHNGLQPCHSPAFQVLPDAKDPNPKHTSLFGTTSAKQVCHTLNPTRCHPSTGNICIRRRGRVKRKRRKKTGKRESSGH